MFKSWGIKTRVLLLTFIPTLTISISLGAYFTSARIKDLSNALNDRGYAIASQLAPASEFGVFARDKHTLQRLADLTLIEPEVTGVAIFDRQGNRLVNSGNIIDQLNMATQIKYTDKNLSMSRIKEGIRYTLPIVSKAAAIEDFPESDQLSIKKQKVASIENITGWVVIQMATTSTQLSQYQALMASAIIVLLGLAISALFALRMSKDVTQPILSLAETVEKIKDGNLNIRVNLNAKGELRRLETGINSMAKSLQAAHDEMQQSVEQATQDLRQTLETIEIQNIELQIARRDAEAASKVKSEFLANMSHEIRTPLNAVIGFVNLLMKTSLKIQQKDYLNTIHTSASSLLNIINDILDFSKMEAGKLTLESTSLDIRDCVEEALSLLAPSAQSKNLELLYIVYQDVPYRIISDPLRIKQIITNLVNNAIKFTESGSVTVRVMLENEKPPHVTLKISVTDTGIGLSPDNQQQIFNSFSQVDTSAARKYGGTGLGLVICKKLVEQMGGDIGVESELNNGSSFWFTLLLDKDYKHKVDPTKDVLKDYRALLYEPHPTLRLALKHLLNFWGIKVTEMVDPSKFKERIENADEMMNPIHICFVGLPMQQSKRKYVESIITETKAIKNRPPMGVFVNSTEREAHGNLIRKGAAFTLTKPIVRTKLLQSLIKELHTTELNTHDDSKTLLNDEVTNKEEIKITSPFIEQHAGKIKLLAVDDNPANLKLVTTLLSGLGIVTSAASDGNEALELIREEEFDIIFMDIQMPGLDGLETTKLIRTLNIPWKNLPVIALTAHAMAGEKERLLENGMNDYITKPIKEEDIQKMIEKWAPNLSDTIAKRNSKEDSSNKTAKTEQDLDPAPVLTDPNNKLAINWQKSLELVGQKEALAKDMLVMLIKSIAETKTIFEDSLKNKQWDVLKNEVHKFHGGCCYVGVERLKALANDTETMLKKNKFDSIPDMIDQLIIEMDKVVIDSHSFIG